MPPARKWLLSIIAVVLVALGIYALDFRAFLAPRPDSARNPERPAEAAWDVWGRPVTVAEAAELQKTPEGRTMLSEASGAVRIDSELLDLGRKTFYNETFGNEFVVTEILGVLDGPLTPMQFTKAIAALGGSGTTNLRVELAESVTVGGRHLEKGAVIDTGLDVPKGALAPLGMPIGKNGARVQVGITCALCHSTVDPKTFELVHGAPNTDVRVGLLSALAPNTSSFFAHANIADFRPYIRDRSRTITGSDGAAHALPDPMALENAVDAVIMNWPPGSFDSMIDLKADPTQVPTSFTRGVTPFGWSGFAAVGPFRGLSSLNNNVHGLNSDPFTNSELSPQLFGLDKELYMALLLQNASNPRYHFDPARGQKPSEFLASIDPTPGVPATNTLVTLPHFPKGSLLSPTGLLASRSGEAVWKQINALSAWQDTLNPPLAAAKPEQVASGRAVFERANCVQCHSEPTYSNGRIIPAPEIRTEPTRAGAFAKTERSMAAAVVYAYDQEVPLPANARTVPVPTNHLDPEQVKLAMAWSGSPGGYRVAPLVGLYWSAPYLHDGGVAAGPAVDTQLGVTASFRGGGTPDPRNSLRALVDRELRQKVVSANRADPAMQSVHVTGEGHEFWVDTAAGFDAGQQEALLDFLLILSSPEFR